MTAGPPLQLSFVIPVHDEAGNLGPLHAELRRVADGLGVTYEIIFVNVGSEDDTRSRLEALSLIQQHGPGSEGENPHHAQGKITKPLHQMRTFLHVRLNP